MDDKSPIVELVWDIRVLLISEAAEFKDVSIGYAMKAVLTALNPMAWSIGTIFFVRSVTAVPFFEA